MVKGILQVVLVLVSLTLFIISSGNPFAAGRVVEGEGQLTSIEADGSLLIDGGGYLVGEKAAILDGEGKKVSLYRIPLPSRIYFEYEYTRRGPVISLIKVIPRVVPQ